MGRGGERKEKGSQGGRKVWGKGERRREIAGKKKGVGRGEEKDSQSVGRGGVGKREGQRLEKKWVERV